MATDAKVLDAGTQEARVGRALGEIVGGVFSAVGGVGGEILGGFATATGIGAGVGVPTIAVSTTVVVGGVANAAAGVRGLSQVLLSTGSGSGGQPSSAAPPRGRAPEFPRGKLKEADFPGAAQKFLGPGYKETSPGRYVSADGLRQVRYGAHETSAAVHHAHFEAYDAPGGRIVENGQVELEP